MTWKHLNVEMLDTKAAKNHFWKQCLNCLAQIQGLLNITVYQAEIMCDILVI